MQNCNSGPNVVRSVRAFRSEFFNTINRYLTPADTFEDLDDVGMWVSRTAVVPLGLDRLDDLPARLDADRVELRTLSPLTLLTSLWRTTLLFIGFRR